MEWHHSACNRTVPFSYFFSKKETPFSLFWRQPPPSHVHNLPHPVFDGNQWTHLMGKKPTHHHSNKQLFYHPKTKEDWWCASSHASKQLISPHSRNFTYLKSAWCQKCKWNNTPVGQSNIPQLIIPFAYLHCHLHSVVLSCFFLLQLIVGLCDPFDFVTFLTSHYILLLKNPALTAMRGSVLPQLCSKPCKSSLLPHHKKQTLLVCLREHVMPSYCN